MTKESNFQIIEIDNTREAKWVCFDDEEAYKKVEKKIEKINEDKRVNIFIVRISEKNRRNIRRRIMENKHEKSVNERHTHIFV